MIGVSHLVGGQNRGAWAGLTDEDIHVLRYATDDHGNNEQAGAPESDPSSTDEI
jgi:hypothetical protein